jgi:predicted permease
MLFMLGIACATGVLTSLVPALRVSHTKPGVALGGAGRAIGLTRGHRRVASALQGTQIALTLVLLTASGLLTSSFVRMMWADPGFDSEHLGYANVSLPVAAYPSRPQQEEMFDHLLARVRSIQGVTAATVGTPPPGGWTSGSFVVEGVEDDRGSSRRSADIYNIAADYFSVSGVRLRYGRVFGPDDSPTAPAAAIIDAATAERVWPGESALGRRFRYSPYVPWLTIVGVVEPVSTTKFSADSVQVYLPRSQQSSGAYGTLLFRTSREVTALLPAIRAEVQRSDSRIGVESVAPVAALYGDALRPRRVVLVLLDLFAAMALTIAGVGLYGLLSYSVSRRSQEFGVRIALGADAWNVRRLAVSDAMWPVAGGLIVGLLLTVALSRLARGFVSDISPYDPVTFTIVAVLLLVVAICAAYLPAQRAARADPVVALRSE